MESLRRQASDESTMIVLLNKNLDDDRHEFDLLNGTESTRANQVYSIDDSIHMNGHIVLYLG
jgi:hypothetical protein